MKAIYALMFFFLWTNSSSAEPWYISFPADVEWKTQESAHFRTLFRSGQDALSEKVLRLAEGTYKKIAPIFPDGPEMTWIILADFQDSANGYGINMPWPHMTLFLSPPTASNELSAMDDWLSTLVLHEYVHIRQMYPVKGLWKPMRTIFGSWVIPNGLEPAHFHEGIATFLETELTTGGRGRGSFFKMLRRMAIAEDKWNLESLPLDLNDDSAIEYPHGTRRYYFGYHFFDALWKRKGEAGIRDFNDEFSGNLPYFLNKPIQKVFGESIDEIWTKLYTETQKAGSEEIKQIKSEGLSSLKPLTKSQYSKGDVLLSPDKSKILFLSSQPYEIKKWQLLDPVTGEITNKLDADDTAAEGGCWIKKGDDEFLIYIQGSYEDRYLLNYAAVYNLKSHATGLFTDTKRDIDHVQRVGCNPDGSEIVIYREAATEGEILLYDWKDAAKSNLEVKKVWKLPAGSWVTSFAFDKLPHFLLREANQTGLYRWEGDVPKLISRFKGHAFELQKGNGNGFYAVADFDGRNEIWELTSDSAKKVVSVLGGVNSYTPWENGFLVSSYTHGGYEIAQAGISPNTKTISASREPVTDFVAQRSDASAQLSEAKPYSPFPSVLPTGWIPQTFWVPGGLQIGVWLPGFDVGQRHLYDIYLGYDTRGFPFGDANYTYRFSNPVNLTFSGYYLPQYIISQNALLVSWNTSLGITIKIPNWRPNIKVSLLYGGRTFGTSTNAVGVNFSFSLAKWFIQNPADIAPRRGTRFFFNYSQFFKALGSTSDFYATSAGIDQYAAIPFTKDHIFYGSIRGGMTEGAPLNQSYFLSGGDFLFGSQHDTFYNRGFWPYSFFAQKLLNLNLEYRFPIARIDRGYWIWPVHLESISGAIVADATTYTRVSLATDATYYTPKFFPAVHPSIGAELKTKWVFGYYMPTEIRFGVYHGFGGEPIYATLGVTASL